MISNDEYELIFNLVEKISKTVEINTQFTASTLAIKVNELLSLTLKDGISQWTIRDYAKRKILLPIDNKFGKKPRYVYTKDDLNRIISIYIIKERFHTSFDEAVEITDSIFPVNEILSKEQSTIHKKTLPKGKLNFVTGTVERANRYIGSRCLLHVLAILFDPLPIKTIVVIDKIYEKKSQLISESIAVESCYQIYSRGENRIVAKINPELIPFFYSECEPDVDSYKRTPTIIEFGNEEAIYHYRMTIIWPHERMLLFNEIGLRIIRGSLRRQYLLIWTLLGTLFEYFQPFSGKEVNTLDVIALAITKILPKIDDCLIFIPGRDLENKQILKLHARSSSDLISIPEIIGLPDKFIGWVNQTGIPIIIEDLIHNDSRTPNFRNTEWRSVAAFPAIENENQEVIVVGSSQKKNGISIFDTLTCDILTILGSIVRIILVGEPYEENQFYQRIQELSSDHIKKIELEKSLRIAEKIYFNTPANDRPTTQSSLAAIVISINNYEIIEGKNDLSFQKWINDQIQVIINEIYFKFSYINKINSNLVTISPYDKSKYIIVFQSVDIEEEKIKDLSTKIAKNINSLIFNVNHYFDENVIVHSWLLYFTYNYLSQSKKIKSWKPNAVVELIQNRISNALINLPEIVRGNDRLRNGDCEGAIREFLAAIKKDNENPYLYKHLGEAYLNNLAFDEAADNLKIAISLDEQYASAHFLLAEVYASIDENVNSIKEYQSAISLKPDPKYYWSLAEELLINKDFATSISYFETVKKLDPQLKNECDIMLGIIALLNNKPKDAYYNFLRLREDESVNIFANYFLKQARKLCN